MKTMKLRVAIAADHGGFGLKNELVRRLGDEYDIVDLGAERFDPDDDYPDFAESVAHSVASGKTDRGIIICGSGVGASIAANKVRGARACLCHDTYSAHQGVEHDHMNIICLGARVVAAEMALELARAFLGAEFKAEPRFQRRLGKVLAIEEKQGDVIERGGGGGSGRPG